MAERPTDFLALLARRVTGEATPVRPVLPTFFGPVTPVQRIEETQIEEAPRPRVDAMPATPAPAPAVHSEANRAIPPAPQPKSRPVAEPQSTTTKSDAAAIRLEPEPLARLAAEPQPIVARPSIVPAMPRLIAPVARRRDRQVPASPTPQCENIVSVNIARVDVRAVFPTAAPAPAPRKPQTKPPLSLSDYLRERDGA